MNDSATKIISPEIAKSRRFGGFSRYSDRIFSNLTFVFGLVIVGILIGFIIILLIAAMPAISRFGIGFITGTDWNAVTEQFGALPAIYGTLLSSVIGLLIAVPVSLGAAIFLVELAPGWVRGPASFLIEMLAAIPSVIIGLWGLFIMVPFVREVHREGLGRQRTGISTFVSGTSVWCRLSVRRYHSCHHGYPHHHGSEPGCHAGCSQ